MTLINLQAEEIHEEESSTDIIVPVCHIESSTAEVGDALVSLYFLESLVIKLQLSKHFDIFLCRFGRLLVIPSSLSCTKGILFKRSRHVSHKSFTLEMKNLPRFIHIYTYININICKVYIYITILNYDHIPYIWVI